MQLNRRAFDRLYQQYNRRSAVHPDPVECLYQFDDPADREVAGLVASALAYGNVVQILRSVELALDRMGPSPARFVDGAELRDLERGFHGFRHRFTSGEELAALLLGAGEVRRRHGSLNASFCSYMNGDTTGLAALEGFVGELTRAAGRPLPHLLPPPQAGSACKRLHLYLRWMVRKDHVDPGGWTGVPPSALVVPVDTHMHRIGRALRFTERKSADRRTALEITEGFRSIRPEDPVRYDFALTHLGMRRDGSIDGFLVEQERDTV
jgi:uncharacterized protein (TIGR02757 family)